MARVVERCARLGCALGAHPSYPDRPGFGRTTLQMEPRALQHALVEQLAALRDAAASAGVPVVSVKLHGALYHDANASPALAATVVASIKEVFPSMAVALVAPPQGALRDVWTSGGGTFWAEGFADRRYASPHVLMARAQPGALIADPEVAARQALILTHEVDAVCVHGDGPNALAVVTAVRRALQGAGFHGPGEGGLRA